MKQLTKAEEEIMQIFWKLKKAMVAEIIEEMFEPKAYTTVSTIIRILETKEFVDHEKQGKGFNYFPVVERETYTTALIFSFTIISMVLVKACYHSLGKRMSLNDFNGEKNTILKEIKK